MWRCLLGGRREPNGTENRGSLVSGNPTRRTRTTDTDSCCGATREGTDRRRRRLVRRPIGFRYYRQTRRRLPTIAAGRRRHRRRPCTTFTVGKPGNKRPGKTSVNRGRGHRENERGPERVRVPSRIPNTIKLFVSTGRERCCTRSPRVCCLFQRPFFKGNFTEQSQHHKVR